MKSTRSKKKKLILKIVSPAPAAGIWPTQWRRTRRRPNTTYFPGRWGKTGDGVFPASCDSGTSCGLASTIGLQSAEPAAKRQSGTNFVSYVVSCSCVVKIFFFSFPSTRSWPYGPPTLCGSVSARRSTVALSGATATRRSACPAIAWPRRRPAPSATACPPPASSPAPLWTPGSPLRLPPRCWLWN